MTQTLSSFFSSFLLNRAAFSLLLSGGLDLSAAAAVGKDLQTMTGLSRQGGEPFGANQAVIDAYVKPDVYSSQYIQSLKDRGELTQKECKVEALNKFLSESMELTPAEHDHFYRNLSMKFVRKQQSTLDSFLHRHQDQEMAKIRSKRLQKSISGEALEP